MERTGHAYGERVGRQALTKTWLVITTLEEFRPSWEFASGVMRC